MPYPKKMTTLEKKIAGGTSPRAQRRGGMKLRDVQVKGELFEDGSIEIAILCPVMHTEVVKLPHSTVLNIQLASKE